MKYEIQSSADTISIHFSGEMDMHYSPVVRAQILAQLEDGRALRINLREVSYMDSSGIACLIEGLQKARGQQVDFVLVMPQSQVLQVLKLARLDQVFTIIDNE